MSIGLPWLVANPFSAVIMNVNIEICNAFNTHAHQYERAAVVQQEIGERLFERLDYFKKKPMTILDLGCGPGGFSKKLKKQYPRAMVIGFDLAIDMLKQAQSKQKWFQKWPLVAGDMANLPFAMGAFDLIFANQVLHWSLSIPSVLRELNRIMKPDACLIFSTLGPDTFQEIRHAWARVDNYSHTNDFIDMHEMGDHLMAQHFLDPVVDMDMLTIHYPSLSQLLQALKAQGVRNVNHARNPGLTGKRVRQDFEKEITQFKTVDGKFPLTYEVVYGHAWKGNQYYTNKGTETMISVDQLRKTIKL